MGRKTNQATTSIKTKNSNKKNKTPKEERELLDAVDNLLRLTTLPIHNNLPHALECQRQIISYLDRIRIVEDKLLRKQNKVSTNNNTTESTVQTRLSQDVIQNFTKWMKENGGELHGCSISSFDEYDLGIKVDQDIDQSSLVIAVPRKVMMSVEVAAKSVIKDLINKVEILKNMPNVLLSIYLLVEKFSPNSFWKPYFDILPKTYSTVLYFTQNDLEELKGSPTLEVALRQIKSIVRQYAYFHKLFWNSDDPVCELMRSKFSFHEYCWAVSTVMTRQNMIPSEDGSTMINSLIPLWDMCNHSNGTISTDYNPQLDRSESLAFRDFKAGEQLFIFYGPRTNSDFFIHNGFVYNENENDLYWIRLGISKSDPLQEKRKELLNKLGIWSTAEFSIKKGPRPVDGRLLAFLRVFNMDADQLEHWLESDKSSDLQYQECGLETSLELKSWAFLKARLNLLLSSYKTTLEEDQKLLSAKKIGNNMRTAIKMRLCEKTILRDCLNYVDEMIQK
ncbi:actin-histidine N-methyltransferase [Sitophilus oryzae]|uniref:protein-histidine N-methyltransferase n=1 Tax=Sitophilus oryzae TaxID=7048 RepID=A0A6J2X2X5_SITOR|nr:actin-histidine N-methyltransferase [Sitophilus oryzae]XP_030745558.1 actin-histidine N-methyltransferase [Sitophilus oryzae]